MLNFNTISNLLLFLFFLGGITLFWVVYLSISRIILLTNKKIDDRVTQLDSNQINQINQIIGEYKYLIAEVEKLKKKEKESENFSSLFSVYLKSFNEKNKQSQILVERDINVTHIESPSIKYDSLYKRADSKSNRNAILNN
jgi:predicted DNA-binding ribbon-helix-helix protein